MRPERLHIAPAVPECPEVSSQDNLIPTGGSHFTSRRPAGDVLRN